MEQKLLSKEWPNSQLNTAISSLTYGLNCLYYDRSNTLIPCLLSVHQQYINIIHVIINEKVSYLFELQNVRGISNNDISVKQSLKAINFEHFIVVHTSTLESYVLVMYSQNQINVLWEGLQYFVYQAHNFYKRISLMDPFKTQTTMIFMNADADGSKLLDIEQALNIFEKLRIKKTKEEIENSIMQINTDLYEKQNLKKPKGFENNMLTPLGFQYILQFYSLKISLAPIFTQFCPTFKFKHKNIKKTITDILKNQSKPLMSGKQFKQFLQKYIKTTKTQQQCVSFIRTFPIYDGEGKEIPDQSQFLSFHNFCNFIFSPTNCIIDPNISKIHQDMDLPLNEYFIYSSNCQSFNTQSYNLLQIYEFILKKGCRCLQISIYNESEQIIVKNQYGKKYSLLSDVLKAIKNICFSFNPFPIIISIDCNFPFQCSQKVAQILKAQLGDSLVTLRNKQQKQLPSPIALRNKIILQLINNSKKINPMNSNVTNSKQQDPFMKLITFLPSRYEVEKKKYICWDSFNFNVKDFLKYEENASVDENLSDNCRKILVRVSSDEKGLQCQNFDPMPMFRNGVQLICINMQKQDISHYLVHSKFLINGGIGCGYLCKPLWMQSNCLQSQYVQNFVRPTHQLKLKVYSGQKLILIDTKSLTFFLQVYIKGTKLQQIKNKKYISEPKNQGFYSDFQMDCEFTIYCKDLAMIVLSVVDQNQKILAFRALPFNSIRTGLRIVELLGHGMEIHQNNCILIQTSIAQEKGKKYTNFSGQV